MGVNVDGPTNAFCNNQAAVKSTRHESTLKKKHNAITYHIVREVQATTGIVCIAKEDGGDTNLADLFTITLPGPRLHGLTDKVLW
jgi:hypothetical protein